MSAPSPAPGAPGSSNAVEDLVRLLEQSPDAVSDADLQRVFSAAVRLYGTRAEETGEYPPPISAESVTPTQAVTVVSEMIRAVDLNLFDLMMWYRRPR